MSRRRARIQSENLSLSEVWQRALAPLWLRPLIWLAFFAVCGIALGGNAALFLSDGDPSQLVRFQGALWWPLPLCLAGALISLLGRQNAPWKRSGIALGVAAFFAFYTGQRLAPPRDDVSRLAQISPVPRGPIEVKAVRLRGVVADFVRRDEQFSSFPLRVSSVDEKAAHGFLWVRASANFPARVGDKIAFDAQILPLDLPSNPGEITRFWTRIGQGCWAQARRVEALQIEKPGVEFLLARRIEELRAAISRRYEALFRGQTSGPNRQNRPFAAHTAQLLTAMVWGEGGLLAPLPSQTRADFRVAGLSHLLVASGAQVGLVCVLLGFWTRRLFSRRALGAAVVVGGVTLYALLAGGAPSVWRAALVGFLGIFCVLAGRETDLLSLWGAALLVLLSLDPLGAWNLSLQFSFGATWGLIVLTPPLAALLGRKLGGFGSQLCAACLGAQWGVLPLSLFHFGAWGALGIGANFLVVPLVAGMMVFGAAALLFPPLGWLLYLTTRFLGWLTHHIAALPGASAEAPPLKIGFVGFCYLVMLLVMWPLAHEAQNALKNSISRWRFRLSNLNLWPLACFCALIALLLTWLALRPAEKRMRAWVFDVGQGHATLLISPTGRAVLVDGGTGSDRAEVGANVLVPALQSLGVSTLDAVILTGRDSKSTAGLPSILREVGVAQIFDGTTPGTTAGAPSRGENEAVTALQYPFYYATLAEARHQKIPVRALSDGLEWRLDEMRVQILAPRRNQRPAIRAVFGQSALLVAHNLGPNDENRLTRRAALRSTILVVPQNGSEAAGSRAFLRAVSPRVGLISTERFNSEKTPSPTLLKRLGEQGALVFRTDINGALEVSCDKKTCTVQPTREVGDPKN